MENRIIILIVFFGVLAVWSQWSYSQLSEVSASKNYVLVKDGIVVLKDYRPIDGFIEAPSYVCPGYYYNPEDKKFTIPPEPSLEEKMAQESENISNETMIKYNFYYAELQKGIVILKDASIPLTKSPSYDEVVLKLLDENGQDSWTKQAIRLIYSWQRVVEELRGDFGHVRSLEAIMEWKRVNGE